MLFICQEADQCADIHAKGSLGPVWDHLKLLYIERLAASCFIFFFFLLVFKIQVSSLRILSCMTAAKGHQGV